MTDFHDMRDRRLWNWSRWSNQGKPYVGFALQCHQFLSGDDDTNEGFGEIDGNTVLAPQLETARAEYEIDIEDAEIVNGWVVQLPSRHKTALATRYLHKRRGWSRDDVDAAVRAILGLADANRAVIERMICRKSV